MKKIEDIKELIKKHITLGEILADMGRITNGVLEEEQFSCPFHGKDTKKSARYYRATDTCYCFFCHTSWDIYSFLAKRDNYDFKGVLNYLIKSYHIDITPLPEAISVNGNKIRIKDDVKIDNNKLFLEKIKDRIIDGQDILEKDKYVRLAFAYMILKYRIPEEKFKEEALKLKTALEKFIKG